MRTRNADNPKSPPPAKKTPPARKSATKTPPPPASQSTPTPKRAASTRGKAAATPDTPVEAIKAVGDAVEVTPGTKSGTKRTVKRMVKRTVIRKKTPASAKVGDDSVAVEVGESVDKQSLEEHAKEEELSRDIIQNSACKEEHVVDDVVMSAQEKGKDVVEAEDTRKGTEETSVENLGSSLSQDGSDITDIQKSLEHQKPIVADMEIEEKSLEVVKEELDDKEPSSEEAEMDDKEPSSEEAEVDDKERSSEKAEVDDEEPSSEKEEADDKEPGSEKAEADDKEPSSEKAEADDKEPSLEKAEADDKEPSSEKAEVDEKAPSLEKAEGDEKEPSLEKQEGGEKEPSLDKEEVDEKDSKEIDVEKSVGIHESGVEVEKEDEKEKEKVEPHVQKLIEDPGMELEKDVEMEEEEHMEINEDKLGPVDMDKDINEESKGEDDPQERVCLSDEERDKDLDHDAHEEDEEDENADDMVKEHDEVGQALEEEHEEIMAAAEDRRRRKELEIFVGGLDRDATEEDVKKAFENVGEVVEVRLHKELPTNKNKGYAFVRFAKKEQAARALSEMKNPVIHGKRCGTAPSEDNDTLFLGNICNTWTKEAIRQKLKEYGIEGVERITLVADAQHEGLSRGFAFLEFSGHPDAMLGYKRLQKPDAIFGHPKRTAKVAFAEPLREPDPEVLAQVKSVFVDGLPSHWDEDIVREHFKGYGDIERVMLARNMSTAKRKDFGFVDFITHEAAVACIDGINRRELGDGKVKVRARLSNPLPKTQAVKGGISGGFRIGHGSGATFPKSGRGFRGVAHPSNRMSFQGGRGFQHGYGQTIRTGFNQYYQPAGSYPPVRGRHNFGRGYGGRWNDFRSPHQSSGQGFVPARFDVDRPRHGAITDRDHPIPMRGQPFLPEEDFSRPYGGRQYEDPYGDTARGIKRPFFADQGPDYAEPSRGRPRLDYSDPAIAVPGARHRGGGNDVPSRDYYNYDYNGAYSSYYGGDRPYGGVRPYGGRSYGNDPPYGGRYYH